MSEDEVKIEYLQKITQSDFYKNDKEFLTIIKKLTAQAASLNNKAVSLMAVLNEAERIKLDMVQKEIDLGLRSDDKPYGSSDLDMVINDALEYENKNSKLLPYTERFVEILENYFDVDSLEEKKKMLEDARKLVHFLPKYGVFPHYFIINSKRSKVWHILEHAYGKTLRRVSIDFFIEKIRTTRLQHIDAVDTIKEYHQNRKKIFKQIGALRKEDEVDQHKIDILKKQLDKELDVNVAPLLIDTHKIMESLDFMIEDIPQELEVHQLRELEEFLPVLSEYYVDQIYALSGGNAFTTVAKNLQEIQALIDAQKSAGEILEAVHKLSLTMQHLYILHWITESLLKELLECFSMHNCSLGSTIKRYKSVYKDTQTSLSAIQEAVYFRNDIAHNGIIWNPEGIKKAIENYRIYIDQVAKERSFDMFEFYLNKMDRMLTPQQKKARVDEYLKKWFKIEDSSVLDESLVEKLTHDLQKHQWKLSKGKRYFYKGQIHNHINEAFAQQYLQMSYEQASQYFVEFAKKEFTLKEGEDLHQRALGLFHYCSTNIHNPLEKEKVEQKIETLRYRIEQVSNKRYKKGLFSWITH